MSGEDQTLRTLQTPKRIDDIARTFGDQYEQVSEVSEVSEEEGGSPPIAEVEKGIRRDPVTGRLLPGTAAVNPGGRPRSGRAGVLEMIDALLCEGETLKSLKDAFRELAMNHPVQFWRLIVLPLLPKETSLRLDGDGGDVAAAVVMVRRALGMNNGEGQR